MKACIQEEQTRQAQPPQKPVMLAPMGNEQFPQNQAAAEQTDMTAILVKVIEVLSNHQVMNLVETLGRPGAIELLQSLKEAKVNIIE